MKSDLIGIKNSNEIAHMLPMEAALLVDSSTELLFLKKFAEGQLNTFDFQGKYLQKTTEEKEGSRSKAEKKGPIILCIDTSGSMHGSPEQIAKVLAFSLMKIALSEDRNCFLISFSTSIQILDLADKAHALENLIAFLSMSFDGGTDLTPAFEKALEILQTESYKNADVLLVSDGVVPIPHSGVLKKIELAQEQKTKFVILTIGETVNPELAKIFDSTWSYLPNEKQALEKLVQQVKDWEKSM